MLTRTDVTQLKKTRERVQEIERRLEASSHDFPSGRLIDACRSEDEAILNVLILAKVHDLTPQKSTT